jgi:polyhydroxyalkanoate synthesis regulator phasin
MTKSTSTSDILRKVILVAVGATAVTAEKVNSLVDELVEKGEMSKQQAEDLKEEVKEKSMQEKDAFENKFQATMDKAIAKVIKDMGIATVNDLNALEKRLLTKIAHARKEGEEDINTEGN